jgi:hypothetical protein
MPLSRITLDALPPVVQLLIRNLPLGGTVADYHRALRKLLPELRRQAEFYVTEAIRANHDAVVSGIEAVKNLRSALQRNVNRQLSLEALFLGEIDNAKAPGREDA